MNENDLHSDEATREFADRVTLFIYAPNRPLTPQLRLTCAFPPLTPPAAAVIDAAVRVWGHDLFSIDGGRMLVRTLALMGPVAAAEGFVLQMDLPEHRMTDRTLETGDAFKAVFARYPDAFLQGARDVLAPFVRRPRGQAPD
ncbi:MAG: hypothetical protein KGQ57_00025 [Burkholderiales bacterium]|nr:hypothetical protein [Burkholderiales bacterium]